MFGECKKYRVSKLYDLSRDRRSLDETFLLKDRKDSFFRKRSLPSFTTAKMFSRRTIMGHPHVENIDDVDVVPVEITSILC